MILKRAVNIIAFALALVLPRMLPAQGTIYLSNLDYTSVTNTVVGNDSWRAADFRTGTNSLGYTLNSIKLLMDPASGNPSGFNVMLYSGGSVPGNYLGSLSGSDPATGGVFTYAASSLTLLPATFYYVVLTSGTSVADGAYNWSVASVGQSTVSDGWRLGGGYFGSSDGASWTPYRPNPFQFAVDATAIPEPAFCALVGLGLVGLRFWRCQRRPVKES